MVDKGKYISRYKALHKRDYNEDISDALALEYFENLVSLVRAVYQPIPKEKNNGTAKPSNTYRGGNRN